MKVAIQGESYEIPFHRGEPLLGMMPDLTPLYRINDAGTKYCFGHKAFLPAGEFDGERRPDGYNNPRCRACAAH